MNSDQEINECLGIERDHRIRFVPIHSAALNSIKFPAVSRRELHSDCVSRRLPSPLEVSGSLTVMKRVFKSAVQPCFSKFLIFFAFKLIFFSVFLDHVKNKLKKIKKILF